MSTGRVNPTIGPPPPNVVADVPPLEPNDEPDSPLPGLEEEGCPNELPLCCPKLDPEDPKLDPEEPKLEPEDPKLDPEDPKLEPDDPKLEPEDPKPVPEELPPVAPEPDWSPLATGTPFASVVVVAATAYIELLVIPTPAVISGCPKKPSGRTCACPKNTGFQSALPVIGSVYLFRRNRIWFVSTS